MRVPQHVGGALLHCAPDPNDEARGRAVQPPGPAREPSRRLAGPSLDAILERVAWWAEVFEAPCVAFAAGIEEVAPLVRAGADFIALGDWIWRDPRNVAATIADLRGDHRPSTHDIVEALHLRGAATP